LWSLENNSQLVVGQHSAPIKHIFWVEELQAVLTGSWDKTLKYWNGQSSNPVLSINVPERVYCMDVKGSCCIVGTAERNILIYDLRKPDVEYRVIILLNKFTFEAIYFSLKISKPSAFNFSR
jgi:mRNA export factor